MIRFSCLINNLNLFFFLVSFLSIDSYFQNDKEKTAQELDFFYYLHSEYNFDVIIILNTDTTFIKLNREKNECSKTELPSIQMTHQVSMFIKF
jgi:hypothetical protein